MSKKGEQKKKHGKKKLREEEEEEEEEEKEEEEEEEGGRGEGVTQKRRINFLGLPIQAEQGRELDAVQQVVDAVRVLRPLFLTEDQKKKEKKRKDADVEKWTNEMRDAAEGNDVETIKKCLLHVPVDSPTTGAMMCDTTVLSFAVGCDSDDAAEYLISRGYFRLGFVGFVFV